MLNNYYQIWTKCRKIYIKKIFKNTHVHLNTALEEYNAIPSIYEW